MNTTEIPFNKYIGITKPQSQDGHLLELPSAKQYENHLGTVHASAQFALAEACSGEYLLQTFAEHAGHIVPVVRGVETKFKKPAEGTLFAQASLAGNTPDEILSKLAAKGRVMVKVDVLISNSKQETTMTAQINWYIQKLES